MSYGSRCQHLLDMCWCMKCHNKKYYKAERKRNCPTTPPHDDAYMSGDANALSFSPETRVMMHPYPSLAQQLQQQISFHSQKILICMVVRTA